MIRSLGHSLVAKLIAAQLLVILAGSVTLALVAILVAPDLYHSHVRESLGVVPDALSDHLDHAFVDAMVVSLGLAIGAAALTAVAVSGFLAMRMLRPIKALADGARGIAAGRYHARVPEAGRDELAVLGRAFNEMAGSLEAAERRRHELISDVAHEFRTPLATVGGYVEAMSDGTLPRSDENLGVLAHETRRLTRLVEDLARVSMAEERRLDLRLTVSQPQTAIEQAAHAAAVAYAEKGVVLETPAGHEVVSVLVDVDRIAEVLGNLLANALRHTQPGGHVEIGAACRGEQVEMWVSDTGEGIAGEHLERVFDRFFRVDPARARSSGGSGIGLTIARAIVCAHGGRMWAESGGRGAGARFIVALPPATNEGLAKIEESRSVTNAGS